MPDEVAFRKEVDSIVAYVKSGKGKPPAAPAKDSAEAQAQMKDLMGRTPGFFASFPASALPGAWNTMVAVEIAPTKLEGKYKELIGLAVASQIPCRYCVYFHTSFAKLMGATDAEIGEALAEAALTRQWSTVINGANLDEAAFRKEIDSAVKYMAKQAMANKPK